MTSNPPPGESPQFENTPTEDSPAENSPEMNPSSHESSAATVVPESETEEKSARRPLGPHVFGRFAFFIAVVPFLFYMACNAFASYVESSRAHSAINEQTSKFVLGPLQQTRELLKRQYENEPGRAEQYENDWNLEAIASLLSHDREEEFTAEKLDDLLDPLRDESLEPEFPAKVELRQQLIVLLKMNELEEEHKIREILALKHRHFADLQGESGSEIDSEKIATDTATSTEWFPPDKTWYPTTYTMTIAGTLLLMLLVFPGWLRAPFKITKWSFIVGAVGFVVWIALIEADRRFLHVGSMLSPGGRDAFNPFNELKSNPTWMWQFMAIRFTGLVLVVPFIEEFFIRGFLMRYIDDPDWDQMPLAEHGQLAIMGVIGYGIMTHIGEPLAAAAWFGMVTWLFLKTKSVWDCVVAHAVTNLLLGIFVIYSGSWYLW